MTVPRAGRTAIPAFVGRERELAALDSLLEGALVGHGALVMLVAQPPGVGKTRTPRHVRLSLQARF